jgi:hypothetical protein
MKMDRRGEACRCVGVSVCRCVGALEVRLPVNTAIVTNRFRRS